MGEIIKHVCPEHKVELVPKQTRKYGTRWECPIRGCSVAWWGRDSATPADAETRKARHDFAEAFLQLSPEHGEAIAQWFTANGIQGAGFLTAPEARLALGEIQRLRNAAVAAGLRDEIAERVRALSESASVTFVRRMAAEYPSVDLRTCTEPFTLRQIVSVLTSIAVEERDAAERRRARARFDEGSRKPKPPPVETKQKRKMNL